LVRVQANLLSKDLVMADHDERAHAQTSFAQLLLDESPDALIALTLEGRIRSWNRGAQAMFGDDAREAIG